MHRPIMVWRFILCLATIFSVNLFADQGKLVFIRAGDAWSMNTDGSGQQQMTQLGDVQNIRLSNNGIVVMQRGWSLYWMPYGSTFPTPIPNSTPTQYFDVNPTGDRIVLSYLGDSANLYVVDLNGHLKTLIDHNDSFEHVCQYWAKNGYIYFVLSQSGNPYNESIYRIPENQPNSATMIVSSFSQYPAVGGPLNKGAFLYNQPAPMVSLMDADGNNQSTLPNSPNNISGRLDWDGTDNMVYFTTNTNEAWRITTAGVRTLLSANVAQGSMDYGVTTGMPPSRTFLVSFTGFDNAPDGSACFFGESGWPQIGRQVTYDAYHLLSPSRGMTNLLVNLGNIFSPLQFPEVHGKAFTFFTHGENGDGDLGNSCNEPQQYRDHVEAENWLLSFGPIVQNDRIIVVGHSYGGNRARLFAHQIRTHLGRPIDALVLVDAIDWTLCKGLLVFVPGHECLQAYLPPYDISNEDVAGNNVLVFRQTIDSHLRGYRATVNHQPANSTVIGMVHGDIDDSEPVQRTILNLIDPNRQLSNPAVRLSVQQVTINRDLFGGYGVTLVVVNKGPLIADNIVVTQATLGNNPCTNLKVWGPINVGLLQETSSAIVKCTFSEAGLSSHSTAPLTLSGTWSNFTFGLQVRVMVP